MAAEWFYTTNKQQVGPVTLDELRKLADAGTLRRDDLVWCDGMPEWVRADRQQELFVDAAAVKTPSTSVPPARRLEARSGDPRRDDLPPPPLEPRTRRDDDRDRGRDRDEPRSRAKTKGGSGAGMWIGMGASAIILVIVVLGCLGVGGGLIAWLVMRGEDVGPGGADYTLNLGPGVQDQRDFNFRAGQRVQITVTTTRVLGIQPDVDLFVLRGGIQIASDRRVSPDCNLIFTAPANDNYTVRVNNLGPGRASSRVIVKAN